MSVFLVGGAVRDQLLNQPYKDGDWVVVGATPKQMLDLGFRQVGKDFPVFLHPETSEEYALARTERKQGHGYHGFDVQASPDVTLEQDLLRRDLTINAIAQAPDGTLIDPYGGQNDLKNRVLRHVSPAFGEDPLRVLRVARFAARLGPLGFTVAEETLTLMRDMVSEGEVDHLVAERVWKETERALADPQPRRYIETLRECGALKVLFPEIDRLFGVPQRKDYHPEVDTGLHTLMVLEQATRLSEDPQVRFAALVHDLGKGTTPEDILPSHYGHEGRGEKLVKQLCKRYKAPNDFRDIAMITARDHGNAHRAFELRPDTVLKLFQRMDAFRKPHRVEKFLLACIADSRGRTGFEDRDYPQADYLRTAFQAAEGVDAKSISAQALAEGKKGPKIKEAITRAQVSAIAKVKAKLPPKQATS